MTWIKVFGCVRIGGVWYGLVLDSECRGMRFLNIRWIAVRRDGV